MSVSAMLFFAFGSFFFRNIAPSLNRTRNFLSAALRASLHSLDLDQRRSVQALYDIDVMSS
jgi:hypothetical protein